MTSRLIHPRLAQKLQRDFFPQLCTIEQSAGTRTTTGQPTPNPTWSAMPDLTGLACRVGGVSGGERRTSNQVYQDATNIILIQGDHAAINEKYRAVVDGNAYDILLVQRSPEEAVTRLVARVMR